MKKLVSLLLVCLLALSAVAMAEGQYPVTWSQNLDGNDYVYYMDSRNAQYLRRMFPGQSKWQPFLDRDVADPWYSGDFTQTWLDIVEGCERILKELA